MSAARTLRKRRAREQCVSHRLPKISDLRPFLTVGEGVAKIAPLGLKHHCVLWMHLHFIRYCTFYIVSATCGCQNAENVILLNVIGKRHKSLPKHGLKYTSGEENTATVFPCHQCHQCFLRLFSRPFTYFLVLVAVSRSRRWFRSLGWRTNLETERREKSKNRVLILGHPYYQPTPSCPKK